MNFTQITNEYYSRWIGASTEIMKTNGILFIPSSERDKIHAGCSQEFSIYAYVTQKQIIISYSKRLEDEIDILKEKIRSVVTGDEVAIILKEVFNPHVVRLIVFCYNELPGNIDTTNVVQLNDKHYWQYFNFFTTQYKNIDVSEWLEEYFYKTCSNGYAFGIFDHNKLVSVTDAPDMPYIQDKVQEIGINTLAEYRGRGYGKSVAISCIKSIIEQGKCPLWSCSASNTASERLAYSVGFRKLADILALRVL